jgi:hypothetical protein
MARWPDNLGSNLATLALVFILLPLLCLLAYWYVHG